jgi:hypothetical protein
MSPSWRSTAGRASPGTDPALRPHRREYRRAPQRADESLPRRCQHSSRRGLGRLRDAWPEKSMLIRPQAQPQRVMVTRCDHLSTPAKACFFAPMVPRCTVTGSQQRFRSWYEAVRFAAYLATEVSAQVTGRGVMLAGSARRCAPAEFYRCGRCADGAGINTRNCTCCCCRRDQSPHDDDVSANNDPLPPSVDDHIRRLSVRLRVRTVGDEPALT